MSQPGRQRRDYRGQQPEQASATFTAAALQSIDTVIIDIGDTLLPTSRAYTHATRTLYEGLQKDTRLPMDDIADGMLHLRNQELLALPYGLNQHPGLREKFSTGDLVEDYAILRQRMFQQFLDQVQADRDTLDFLKKLNSQGKKIVFMTSLPESAARFVIQGSGLGGLAHKTYAAQDIEQDPAITNGHAANTAPLNETLGGGTDEPIAIIPPGLDVKQELAYVLAAEGADPARTLRIADNPRKDIAPANELGLNTALMTAHRHKGDQGFARAMRQLRQGTGAVQPPQILPARPYYEAPRALEKADYAIHTTKQMYGAAHHLDTGKPHPSQTAAAGGPAYKTGRAS